MTARRLLLLIFCLGSSPEALPQERFYYTGKDFGTEAMFNPVSLILNGSYDVIQFEGIGRNIESFPYAHSWAELSKNLSAPFAAINHYGWGNFFADQVLPFNFSPNHGQWWPNYNLHLLGGGMTYVRTAEWYELHGYPSPKWFSFGTMAVYHLLNEVVEAGEYSGYNVDPIADIYIFDLGGILLFSCDNVKRFFRDEVMLTDWSLQPAFSLTDGTLRNNGQYFAFKWRIPSSDRWHLFYLAGIDGMLGTSYLRDDKSMLSVGAGFRGISRTTLDQGTNRQTVVLAWNVGVFYDRENSLLASLTLTGTYADALSLNIYPGIVRIGPISPSFFLTLDQRGNPTVGVCTRWAPGIAYTY